MKEKHRATYDVNFYPNPKKENPNVSTAPQEIRVFNIQTGCVLGIEERKRLRELGENSDIEADPDELAQRIEESDE